MPTLEYLAEIERLKQKNAELVEALEFYASSNHMRQETVRGRVIEYDVDAGPLYEYYDEYIHSEYPIGKKAREALAKHRAKPEGGE